MANRTVRGIVGLIIIVGFSACSSKVGQTESTTPKVAAPVAAPTKSDDGGMSCVPALYNRMTQRTESFDCSILVKLEDGTLAKDLTRSVRMAAADVVTKGYLVASK